MRTILEPERYREAVEESEKKFRHLAGLMPVGVYSTNEKGYLTFYNDRAAELWGRHPRLNDPTELRYCGALRLYNPDGTLLPRSECFMARTITEKKSFRNKELIFEGTNGILREVMVNIDPVFNDEGRFTGSITVFHDITRSRQAEDDLRRLASIIDSSQDAIISRSLDGTITSWNVGAEQIFGFEKNEILGESIATITPSIYEDEELSLIGKICRGESVDSLDTIRLDKNGNQIHVTLTFSPIKDSRNRVVGISMIARDNRDQMQIRRQLQVYNEQLKQLSQQKSQFIGMASHELKTPLTVIRGHLEWMALESQTNGHLHNNASVNKALIHIEKLSDLVSNLLDVSKVDQGMLNLNPSTYRLSDILLESIDSVRSTEATHEILLETDCDGLEVFVDKQRIEQAVINLLLNAIKYSPDADQVLVRCATDGKNAIVSVKDYGIGIPPDQVDKIFVRFFRVEGLAPTFSGLGVGLYITKEIINRHKGSIWVESTEGEGSTFYVKIPLDR